MSFSLPSRINDYQCRSSIRAPRSGRVDGLLTSHQLAGSQKVLAGLSARREGKSVIFPSLTD
ncbi:MAG: hypothetical protein P1S46_10325, partial [bacterium]|nr:hypothetical protein [bacterium]